MKTTITIEGTHCPACKTLIEDICSDLSEITTCVVDYKTGKAEVEHTDALDWAALKTEIENAGDYKIKSYD